jgi:hypothetical protein
LDIKREFGAFRVQQRREREREELGKRKAARVFFLSTCGYIPARKFLVNPITDPTRSDFDMFNPNPRKKA